MTSNQIVTKAALAHHLRTTADPGGRLREIGQLLELDMALSPDDRAALANVLGQAAGARCIPSTLAAQLHGIAGELTAPSSDLSG